MNKIILQELRMLGYKTVRDESDVEGIKLHILKNDGTKYADALPINKEYTLVRTAPGVFIKSINVVDTYCIGTTPRDFGMVLDIIKDVLIDYDIIKEKKWSTMK